MKDKVVYLHKINEKVVYVGSGNIRRVLSRTNRSKEHLTMFDEISIEIVAEQLTIDEAVSLEQKLINHYGISNLFNIREKVHKVKPVEYEYISKYLYYDETSKSFLKWKKSRRKTMIGSDAGTLLSTGYYQIQLNGKFYLAHRLVYCLCNGVDLDQTLVVDHIDGDKSNNAIDNLRLVTQSFNSRNRQHSVSKTTGLQNIIDIYDEMCIVVQWRENKLQRYKRFSYRSKPNKNNENVFSTRDEAMCAAIAFREQLADSGIIILK